MMASMWPPKLGIGWRRKIFRKGSLCPGEALNMSTGVTAGPFTQRYDAIQRVWVCSVVPLNLAATAWRRWVGSDFLVVRPVRALVRASTRVAAGDLSTRTGLRHGSNEL